MVGVTVTLDVAEGEPVPVCDDVSVSVALPLPVPVSVPLSVYVTDCVSEDEAVHVDVTDWVAVRDCDSVGVDVDVKESLGVSVAEEVREGDSEALCVSETVSDSEEEGEGVRD